MKDDFFNNILVLDGTLDEALTKLRNRIPKPNIYVNRSLSTDLVEVENRSHFDMIGICDLDGNMLCDFIYTIVNPFSEGLAAACNDENKWGFIDKACKKVISFDFDLASDFHEGLAGVLKNSKWGFINRSGKTVIGYQYDFAGDFHEGLASVCKNGKYGFINKDGKTVIGYQYDFADDFHDGLAEVCRNGKWGLIDRHGKEVVHCKYDNLTFITNGQYYVSLDDNHKYIDGKGHEIKPCLKRNDSTDNDYFISDGKLYDRFGKEIEVKVDSEKYKKAYLDITSFFSNYNGTDIYAYDIINGKFSLFSSRTKSRARKKKK